MAEFTGFGPELFAFVRELKQNNERDWFNANKSRFEEHVKQPVMAFIEAFGPKLEAISPFFLWGPRSMFRIYRDTRFSKDKIPYKTHASAHFRHDSAKDVHAPGFYLHLEPGSVFMGGGMWRPDSPSLARIRAAMIASPAGWRNVVDGLELVGDSSLRPPRGIAADHPLIVDLKRKDMMWCDTYSEAEAASPDFVERYAASCRRVLPLCRFLCESLNLEI